MSEVMAFLDQHAGALQAVFALVVAISTASYVLYTRRMWSEMRETNRQLKKADIRIGFEPSTATRTVWDLVIRNEGSIALLDVRLGVDPPDFPGLGGKSIGRLAIFTRPIPVMLPGAEIRTALLNLLPLMNREEAKLTFKASYRTPFHPETTQEFAYDLKAYEGLGWMQEATPNDFLRLAKDMAGTLTSLKQAIEDSTGKLKAELGQLQPTTDSKTALARLRGFVGLWRDSKACGRDLFLGSTLDKVRATAEGLADVLSANALDNPLLSEARPKLREMANMQFYIDGGESLRSFELLGDEVSALIERSLAGDATALKGG